MTPNRFNHNLRRTFHLRQGYGGLRVSIQYAAMKNVSRYLVAVAAFGLWVGTPSAQTPTYPYDHIHLNVPDPAEASAWYEKHIGGTRHTEAPNRIMYGSTRLMFLRSATAKPSAGSAIDHIGFSFPNLDAKMKEWEAAGIKVTTPVRDVPKLFKLAFLEDPWGTRIEVVQDAELLGLHHVHLRAPNPEDTFTWLLDKFGGKRQQLKGMIDAVRYDYEGFSSVWVLVTKGEAEPSQGRAIDHIGWRSVGPLADTMNALRAKQVTVTSEPRPLTLPNGPSINYSYVAGPSGARIELVERPGLKPGQ
jgi:catechol 2,3-dioxygenase-like lactoylglutathione lyase family enzyme